MVDEDALISCLSVFARDVQSLTPDDVLMRAALHRVLSDRSILEAVEAGIITRREGALALLAHMQTYLEATSPSAGVVRAADEALIKAVERGLFGTSDPDAA